MHRETPLFGSRDITAKRMDMPLGLALEVAEECWTWLAETGLTKSMWPGWVTRGIWPDDNWCTLCMHAIEIGGYRNSSLNGCPTCPLYEAYGGCYHTHFRAWHKARTKAKRRREAGKFLKEIRALSE